MYEWEIIYVMYWSGAYCIICHPPRERAAETTGVCKSTAKHAKQSWAFQSTQSETCLRTYSITVAATRPIKYSEISFLRDRVRSTNTDARAPHVAPQHDCIQPHR